MGRLLFLPSHSIMQAQPSLSALVQEKLRNYTPNLTPQELEKAKSELNEHTAEVRNHAINSLARSLEHNCNPQFIAEFLPQISEPRFLLRFLRASKFRPEKSLSRLTKWLRFYSKTEPSWPELSHVLNNPEASGLNTFMRNYNPIYVCPQAGKAVPGAWVMITDPPKDEFPGGLDQYVVMVAAQMITIFDKLLSSESLQVHGIYTLTDSSKTNKNNTKFILKPHLLKKLTSILVGMPVRQKGDISVNTNLFYKMLVKGVSGVLPKKTRERFIQLGKLNELHSVVHVQQLTRSYGGGKSEQECLGYMQMPAVTNAVKVHTNPPNLNVASSNQQSPVLPPRPQLPARPQELPKPVETVDNLITF